MVDGFRLDNSILNDNYNIIWWSKHTVSCISFPIQDIDLEYDFVVHILAYRNNWTTLSRNYSYSFVVCISDSLLIYFFLCQMLPLFDTINDKLIKKKIFDWRTKFLQFDQLNYVTHDLIVDLFYIHLFIYYYSIQIRNDEWMQ
jgi:hypothetical protein